MKSFADISLRWQVLLAPLLLILAILVIEAVNYRQQTGVDAATTRLFDETVRRLTAACRREWSRGRSDKAQ